MPEQRPNVLFVITDQQRADHVGFGGNSVVRTPNLDAVASRGTVFERCYVANPICMPNRCSILTGRMPSSHGVVFNDRSLAWSTNTFVRRLREAGYRTGLLGKSHFQVGMSRDTQRPNPGGPAIYDPYPADWDRLEDPERYLEGSVELPDDFYGFDHVEFTINHGGVASGHHLQWALERGGDRELLLRGNAPDGPAESRSKNWWQIFKPGFPAELYSTTFVTERTIAFIEQASRERKPWLAWCSYPDPHHPLSPPGRWYDAHDPADMKLPRTFGDALEGAPRFMHLLKGLAPVNDPGRMMNPFGPNPEQVREALAATYGMIEMIDDGVGRILAAIERLGSANDTIVVFTSDHGDMMGDHGLILKLLYHYQGCVRVPLVIADPRRLGSRSHSLVSSLDLAQTLLELCGLESFSDMQGRSLAPLLANAQAAVRDALLIEDDFPLSRYGGPIPSRARTVIAHEGRLTRYSTGEGQLFDLAGDPDELRDLFAAPDGRERRAQLTEQLATLMMEHDDMARSEPRADG